MPDPVTTEPVTTEPVATPAPGTPANPPVEDPTLLGPEPKEPSPAAPDGIKPPEDPKKPTEETVPEKYEFKVPEGMELDTATADLFAPVFKELGLSNEKAQKLVDVYAPIAQQLEAKLREKSAEEFKAIVAEWHKESMKMLGATAKEDLASCGKALNKFGTAELRVMLQETGVGNHPEMVKFMKSIGKTISEDVVVDPKTTDAPGQFDPRKMYPTMPQ